MKRYIYLLCSMRIMVLTFFNVLTEINVLVKYKKLLNVQPHQARVKSKLLKQLRILIYINLCEMRCHLF